MKKFKLLALLVVILIAFSACGSSGKSQTSTAAGTTAKASVESTEGKKETDLYALYKTDGLKDVDMGGYTFKIATCLPDTINPKAGSTDVNDAILARVEAVEKRFNCKIEVTKVDYGKMVETLQPKILAGDKVANVIMTNVWEVGGFVTSRTILDLKKVPNLSLDKPWWNKSMSEVSQIRGKTYVAVPYIHSPVDLSFVMFYNKTMAEDLGIENLYDLVDSKKWTWEKFVEVCKKAIKDLDGDGKMTIKDRWGWTGPSYDSFCAFLSSGGLTPIGKNTSGAPYFALNKPEAITKLKAINGMMNKDKIYDPEEVFLKTADLFRSRKALFYSYQLIGGMSFFRDMDDDFGILPFPMASGQTDYKDRVDHNVLCTVVPVTNTELEKTGIIMEALAFSSWKATPTTAELYKNLYLRDDESGKILDSLPNYATFDMSQLAYKSNLTPQIGTLFNNILKNPNADLASIIAAIEPPANVAIAEYFGNS